MTNIIGSKNSRIEIRTSLDGIVMTPEEIAEEEKQPINLPVTEPVVPPTTPQPTAIKKQGMIYVPSIDLYVSEGKVLHGLDWNHQTQQLHAENKRMPTIPEFVSFLNYLRSKDGRKAVSNHQAILDEIYKVEGDWRSENFDAFFFKKSDELYVAYHKFDTNGEIVKIDEKLEDYHSTNEIPGIDLESWLNNPTKQGLPREAVKKGNLYYWAPVEGKVARFYVFSYGAVLYCDRDPTSTVASLGVRYVEPRSGETA
jgi:hypothetical protein